jgi:hypothetical protein
VKDETGLQLVWIITISSKAAWLFRCGHDATGDVETQPVEVMHIYRMSLVSRVS